MLAIVNSCVVIGLEAAAVKVEVDVSSGMPCFDIVGLPDTAVRESKERVRTAIKNSGFDFPLKRITVNLAPADLKKEGANFDLPIAAGILLATEQMTFNGMEKDSLLVGELSLDGTVRGIKGALSMSSAIKKFGCSCFVLPETNANEAALLQNTDVYGITDICTLVKWWNGELLLEKTNVNTNSILAYDNYEYGIDMSDVKGQENVKRAMEIAAAGGHNLLMVGSPGSGKTMLARRMVTILPPMTLEESLETTKLYSVAGELPAGKSLVVERPFRAPHHSASAASVIGGGRVPKPGEVSLATNGVLFLDEMPEFQRSVLEALRQPLEDKLVTISRVNGKMEFSAAFQLVGAMNPCPCGYLGDLHHVCSCTPNQIDRYLSKISGPLLDRIDMVVNVQRIDYDDINDKATGESSSEIRKRVMKARKIQESRYGKHGVFCNANLTRSQMLECCYLEKEAEALLKQAFCTLHLSARSYDKILKVARTVADLSGSEKIDVLHIAEALQYRTFVGKNQ